MRAVSISASHPYEVRIGSGLLSDLGAEEVEASFGAEVSVSALLPLETAPLFCDRLGDVTAGSSKSRVAGSVFRPQKIFSEK